MNKTSDDKKFDLENAYKLLINAYLRAKIEETKQVTTAIKKVARLDENGVNEEVHDARSAKV